MRKWCGHGLSGLCPAKRSLIACDRIVVAFYNWYYVSPAVAVIIGSRWLDIGAGEILALEQERLARRFRECIGETVTEISAPAGDCPCRSAAKRCGLLQHVRP